MEMCHAVVFLNMVNNGRPKVGGGGTATELEHFSTLSQNYPHLKKNHDYRYRKMTLKAGSSVIV